MLGQQFHNCLLGSSGHWHDHSKHTANFRVWVPWTYSLRYCVSLTSAHLSETVSALGGDDSRTFEHKETLQGTGSAKSSQSLERKTLVELSELTSRPTSQNWPREWTASLVTVWIQKPATCCPMWVLRVQGFHCRRGSLLLIPTLERGPSAHVSGPPISEKSNASRSSGSAASVSPHFLQVAWVRLLGRSWVCTWGTPAVHRAGYTVSTWHVCIVKLAQRGRVGQSEPG